MTIYKSSDFLEVYRAKATSKHINELSGRTGRPDLTDFVSRDILNRLPLCSGSILVDVGCGNGRLLEFAAENKVDSFSGRLIGILPTIEEAARLRNHFLETLSCKLISIEVGEVTETNIPDNYADCVVCNGVLLLLQDEQRVRNAISEIARITKPGGTVYIGEIPSKDEMQDKSYDDSIIRWLIWTLKNQGFSNFIHRVRQVFSALTTSEPFIIAPKKVYFSSSNEFIILLENYNFQVINHFRHRLTDSEGSIIECSSRWSYECVKSH
jgi:ubiquinone/menaquinone biosynthesis C-methylase UbiE